MSPRISIITPYRDAAQFLAEAIDSVLAQTVTDWELLLVDDRSGDGGPAVATEYAKRDPRVRMLDTMRSGRSGAAAARNIGLAAARGEFVAFLDADDLFVPDKLEQELELAERYPQAALICGAARWHRLGEADAYWTDRMRHVPTGMHEPPDLVDRLILLRDDQVPCTCAVLAKRDAVMETGGFEESLDLYEDQSVWVKLWTRYPTYLGTHLTSVYRQHSESTSARAERSGAYHRTRLHPARAAFLAWIERYLRNEGLQAPSTLRALRLAQAMLNRDRSGLSTGESIQYAWLIQRDFGRRAQGRLKAILRRLDTGGQPLSPPAP